MPKCIAYLALLLLIPLCSCTKASEDSDTKTAESTGLCGENMKVTNGATCKEATKSPVALLALTIGGVQQGLCTGTLINSHTILTAAHCVDPSAGISGALAGFPKKEAKDFDVYEVSRFAIHPRWNGRPGNPNDVGLMFLKDSVPDRPFVPIIARGARAVRPGDTLYVYGYGKDESAGVGILKRGKMEATGLLTVPGFFAPVIAAEFDRTGQSVCSGDSGGPALVSSPEAFGLVGVTSAGTTDTCLDGSVALFTNLQLDSNINFILDKTEGDAIVIQ